VSLRARIALAYAVALFTIGVLVVVLPFTGMLPARLEVFYREFYVFYPGWDTAFWLLVVVSLTAALLWAQVSIAPLARINAFLRTRHADTPDRLPERGAREWRELARTINEMLDRLDKAAGDQRALFDDASHELRTPLAVVRASVEGVLTHEDVSPAARQRAGEAVLRAVDRMGLLVEDLLAAARSRAGTADSQPLDLADLARSCAADFTQLAAESGVRLELRAGAAGVEGDPAAIARAVHNVLSNAVRVAPPGSAVEVGTGTEAGWRWLAVRDHGPGIPARDAERVFDRFWRGGDQANSTGTGLGLAITRQLVEGHGGAVALHSAAGKGATFVLWFPAARADAGPGRTLRHPDLDPMAVHPA
jgi:signal transduction histidine kinase